MSHVPHPFSGTFLRPWFDHLRPRPKMAPALGGAEMGLGLLARPRGDSDETYMSHVPHPLSGTFLRPWFDHLRPRPKMAPPLGEVPRWVSGHRPAPWGTVMKPTCHMFLIYLVKDFCTLGFPTWGLGSRWALCQDVSWAIGLPPGVQ